MKNKIATIGLIVFAALLTGCSYLQKFFPDKERDYQYTTEIPLLNWPDDLRKKQQGNNAPEAITQPSTALEQSETGAGQSEEGTQPEETAAAATTSATTEETETKETLESVEIVKYDDGESRLRLGAGMAKSWRVISKALSRNSIEVTERDNEKKMFTVEYDPDEKKAKDESFMDELSFIFHGINSNEKEYRLKLEENNQHTDVLVVDESQSPLLNNEPALRLLKILADTTQSDINEKNK
ncbi:MAG: outer membrane protein assembly factor BamC [Methyloglobulus sp.]|nr:outer membrane protein assembly factor BamC [Methyloglobulus sp.]